MGRVNGGNSNVNIDPYKVAVCLAGLLVSLFAWVAANTASDVKALLQQVSANTSAIADLRSRFQHFENNQRHSKP